MKTDTAALRTTVIVNAGAGQGHGAALRDDLAAQFLRAGLPVDVILAKGGAELLASARDAVARGVPTVVAGGGDGTINAIASVVADSPVVLGVLPMGTLNHFAKDLGIPLEINEAIRIITEGRVARVDMGEVNGQLFLNNSSLGIYPSIVRNRERQQRHNGRNKWLAFAWAMVAALRRFPFLHVRLTVDHGEATRSTPFVFIGNNRYLMEGFDIGTRARLDEGLLSLYVAQRSGRLRLVALALRALFGKLAQAHDFTSVATSKITVETRHAHLAVATDGEVHTMRTPLHYRIRPGTLRVFVPASSTAARPAPMQNGNA